MDEWLKSLGPGQFTVGAKYFCFKPDGKTGPDAYTQFAQALPGQAGTEEWFVFAELLVEHLNNHKANLK